MKRRNHFTAFTIILSIIMSVCMVGCGGSDTEGQESIKESSAASSAVSTPADVSESGGEGDTSTVPAWAQSSVEESIPDQMPSQQPTENESALKKKKMKNEAEVKKLVSKLKPGKTLYDEIYKLEDFQAGGHVITDLDGDGTLELVIRSKSRKTISIYKAEDKVLKGPIVLQASEQADMRYGFFSEDKKFCDNMCFFTTLKDMGGNTYVMNVYNYAGIDKELELVRSVVYTASFVENDMSKVQFTTEDPGYLEYSWQESFNDGCKSIITLKENDKKPDVKKTAKFLSDFASKYYAKDDLVLNICGGMTVDGSALPIGSVSDLAKNEVLAKHGQIFDHPLCTAFFNKMGNYEATQPQGRYSIEKYADEKDFTQTDKNIIEALIEYDNTL